MFMFRLIARSLSSAVALGAVLLVGCAPGASEVVGPREQDQVLESPTNNSPEHVKYRGALEEFNRTVVPAAKKEGQLNWYACTDSQEAELWIAHFNKYYPEVNVNQIYGEGFQLVEKITAEIAANRPQADVYICGINSARTLAARPNTEVPALAPSAWNPDIKWNWPVLENNGTRVRWSLNGIGGFKVNTKLVPEDKYPKTWADILKDPYWVDLIKRGLVEVTDPRTTGMTHQIFYGLRVLNKDQYGEKWYQELAALKPRKAPPGDSRVTTGEIYAHIGGSLTLRDMEPSAPVKLLCPDPGCVQSYLAPIIIKGGPNPNAAQLWSEFWLTKEGQAKLAAIRYTVNRPDVPVPAKTDWKNYHQMYLSEETHEKGLLDARKYNQDSGLWAY